MHPVFFGILKTKRAPRWTEWILFAILLLAVCLLPRPDIAPAKGHHGYLSSHGLTLAAHLSPEHHFLMYNRIVIDSTGTEHYEAYNRFSIVPFALIRCAMAFGGDDLLAQVAAARKLMQLFWLGAMFCAWLAFKRLGRDPFAALTIVLLSFSSHYFLYYGDMVFNDIPALFGCMLLFHGLVEHWQENRPRQLLAKALVAVALGWQAFAMLFPAVALLWWKNRRTKENLLLAGAPLLLGIALLAFNLANECIATRTPLLETSTAKSIVFRLGRAPESSYAPYARSLDRGNFIQEQLYRVGVASAPPAIMQTVNCVNRPLLLLAGKWIVWRNTVSHGILALALVVLVIVLRRKEWFPPLCLLALAFCWTLPMRHFTAFHDFQAIFLVGIPLILFDALLRIVPSRSKSLPLLALGALISLSAAAIGSYDAKLAEQEDAHLRLVALQTIANSLRAEEHPVIHVDAEAFTTIGGARHTLGFALPKARFTDDQRQAQWHLSDNPLRIEQIVQ